MNHPECFLCLEGEFPDEEQLPVAHSQSTQSSDNSASDESLLGNKDKGECDGKEHRCLMPLVVSGCECHPWVHQECLQEWVNVRQEHCCPICRREGRIEGVVYPDDSSFLWNLWGGGAPRVTSGSVHQVQWYAFGGHVYRNHVQVPEFIEMGQLQTQSQQPPSPPTQGPDAGVMLARRDEARRKLCLTVFVFVVVIFFIFIISYFDHQSQ
jgi:hypothetical protein